MSFMILDAAQVQYRILKMLAEIIQAAYEAFLLEYDRIGALANQMI
jgi:hypothetical protein